MKKKKQTLNLQIAVAKSPEDSLGNGRLRGHVSLHNTAWINYMEDKKIISFQWDFHGN